MSDQRGANVAGFLHLWRKQGAATRAVARYLRHPVMLTSLGIVLVAPLGLLTARAAGFSPETQILTAVETILANLCWLPPVMRSEEHTSDLQSLMRISYAVFCLTKQIRSRRK